MIFHSTETTDMDEFDISATYGSAVFLVHPEKQGSEKLNDHTAHRIGHLVEYHDYPLRHPKAA